MLIISIIPYLVRNFCFVGRSLLFEIVTRGEGDPPIYPDYYIHWLKLLKTFRGFQVG